jgi:hypothetical protein
MAFQIKTNNLIAFFRRENTEATRSQKWKCWDKGKIMAPDIPQNDSATAMEL